MKITWINQGGFIFQQSSYRLVVDPYLSDVVEKQHNWTRLAKSPIRVEDLKPDAVFCTHNHIDHLDPVSIPKIARQYPGCCFWGPQSVGEELVRLGIDPTRFYLIKPDQSKKINNMVMAAVPARHSDDHAIGVVLKAEGKCIYLSGDTLYYPSLASEVLQSSGQKIDLALICINGRLGNMSIDEAVEVVKTINPHMAAPMHYGLFAENTVDPQLFTEKCRMVGIRPFLFKMGQQTSLDKLLAGANYEGS